VAPVTVFLRLEGGLADCARGLPARLELHSGYDDETIVVDGREVPVETDRSAVLARGLDDPEAWRFSVSGLFGSARAKDENRLILVQPYAPGRVPVVFVHGTASSPAYWAETFNTLWADPSLRSRTQMWFFRYTTGNPILYSAAELRDALRETVAALDRTGEDPALRRMVLIGHSQGGLLVRLLLTQGGEPWVEELMGRSLPELGLERDEEELFARCTEFEPLPLVARAIFVSTPHRGSFLSDRWYSRLISRLISFPADVMKIVYRPHYYQFGFGCCCLPFSHRVAICG
jgi:pimeloyl-ACP methyl ester carboxylesterase